MAPTRINAERAREDVAFVVGISKYPSLGENFGPNDLGGPINDAHAVTRWLVSTAGVPCENVRLLTSSGEGDCRATDGALRESFDNPPPRPRLHQIDTVFKDFVGRSSQTVNRPGRLGRRFWIYMAGHGFAPQNDTRDVCILPANAQRQVMIENFCATKWADWVAQTNCFDEIVLWLDCCCGVSYRATPYLPPSEAGETRDMPAARFFVKASDFGKLAYEAADDTGHVGGLFTRKLLSGLNGAARPSANGWLTSEDLRRYFLSQNGAVVVVVDGRQLIQKPQVIEAGDMEIVHIAEAANTTYAVPVDLAPDVAVDVLDFTGARVGSYRIGADRKVRVALASGLYKISGPQGFTLLFETRFDLVDAQGESP